MSLELVDVYVGWERLKSEVALDTEEPQQTLTLQPACRQRISPDIFILVL